MDIPPPDEARPSGIIDVRPAGTADLGLMPSIQAGDGYEHHYLLTEERLGALQQRGEAFFLAHLDGVPVGFASVDFEQRARLHFLCVLTEHTKKGVGTSLMRKMLEESKARGYTSAHTYVEAGSPKEDFLRSQGFSQVGEFRDRYGKGKDASIWQIDLERHED